MHSRYTEKRKSRLGANVTMLLITSREAMEFESKKFCKLVAKHWETRIFAFSKKRGSDLPSGSNMCLENAPSLAPKPSESLSVEFKSA